MQMCIINIQGRIYFLIFFTASAIPQVKEQQYSQPLIQKLRKLLGKRYGNICICITDSLCYKAETNTPL